MSPIEKVLREHGLSDQPQTYDSDIHSWRCSYPERYGACSCLADLLTDLTEALVAAFYEKFPGIGDRENLSEDELREMLAGEQGGQP